MPEEAMANPKEIIIKEEEDSQDDLLEDEMEDEKNND